MYDNNVRMLTGKVLPFHLPKNRKDLGSRQLLPRTANLYPLAGVRKILHKSLQPGDIFYYLFA
jgi:hypothetical protein